MQSTLVTMRSLVMLFGMLALAACEPGRCLRHSDCPTGASCKQGVCRLPAKQSTSLAQPGDEENQSSESSESVAQDEDEPASVMDATAVQARADASGDLASDEQERETDDTASQSSGRVTSEDASAVADANTAPGPLDAAHTVDAATDAAATDAALSSQ